MIGACSARWRTAAGLLGSGRMLLKRPQRFHVGIQRISLCNRCHFDAMHPVRMRQAVRYAVQNVLESGIGGLISRKSTLHFCF